MSALSRARLEQLLSDLVFPASRREVVDHVVGKERHDSVKQTLAALPDRKYASPAEAGHALDPVQPATWEPKPMAPDTESGSPPGHGLYTEQSA